MSDWLGRISYDRLGNRVQEREVILVPYKPLTRIHQFNQKFSTGIRGYKRMYKIEAAGDDNSLATRLQISLMHSHPSVLPAQCSLAEGPKRSREQRCL